MNRKILVIGSTNVDFVVSTDHTPVVGETILGQDFKKVPGGKGANQALACGRLGGDTTFLTSVGGDELGEYALLNMNSANVDISSAVRCKQVDTGMAMICVNRDGDNSIVVIPGANACCDLSYIRKNIQHISTADILLAQLETPVDGVYHALEVGKQLNKLTILNPAPAPERIPDLVYCGLDYLTPNETELARLTGLPVDTLDQVEVAAKILLHKGVKQVIVTLGKRGAMLCDATGTSVFSPPHVAAMDTTAAGDTFNGALAVMLAEGATIYEAISFANAASALAVSRAGAQISIPTRKEVDGFMMTLDKERRK